MKKQVVLIGIIMIALFVGSSAFGVVGLNGVFGQLGYVSPEGDIGSTIGFGGGVNLGTIAPKVVLEGDLTYWKKGYDEESVYYKTEIDFSQLNIAAFARYQLGQPGAKIQPEIGGGLGIAMSKWSGSTTYTGPEYPYMKTASPTAIMASSDSDSKSGLVIHLSGLVRTQLSPKMEGVAELRYSLGGDDHGDNLSIWAKVNYLLKP